MQWSWSSKMALAFSGILSVAVAAPAQEKWTKKTDMPTARMSLSTSVVDGKIYAIGGTVSGGSVALSAVEEYDPATDAWTNRASIPEARCALSISAIDRKIYAIGGATSLYGAVSSSAYVYEPATDTWARKADMPTPRAFLSTTVVDGKIYAIGGASSGISLAYKTVEEYDPATDTWTKKADMPAARLGLSTSVVEGKICAVGGTTGAPWPGPSTVESYDPATDTWIRKAAMPTPRWGLAAGEVGGRIYAVGGAGAPSPTSSAMEEHDPVADTWTRKAAMPTARRLLSASVVEGKIYAMGGIIGDTAIRTVEEYDTGLTVPSPDFNGDSKVDIQDLLRLIESWGQNDPSVDIAPPPFGDGVVDEKDLEVLMSYWGQEIPNPALIAHWELDEDEGVVAADSAGTSNGVLVGDPIWQPTRGSLGGALQFDGVDDFILTSLIVDPSAGPFSVFAWVKDGGPGQVILSQEKGANWLVAGTPDGALTTELKSAGRNGKALKSAVSITDGAWHRVGFVWNGSSRVLYVDDVEVARDM